MDDSPPRSAVRLVRGRPVAALVVWFLLVGQPLAFAPVVADANGTSLPTLPFLIASNVLGLLLPALVLTRVLEGRGAVVALCRRAARVRIGIWWYAQPFVVVPLAGTAVTVGLLGPPADTSLSTVGAAVLLGLLVQTLVGLLVVNLCEEVVWTGFVQDRFQRRHSPLVAAALTAPLFAVQHLSLVAGGSVLGTAVVLLAVTLLAVPFRVVLGWTYNRTGSLLLIGLTHAAGNAVSLDGGLVRRLYPDDSPGPVHLFAFAALGVLVLVGTRGRLGRPAARAARTGPAAVPSPGQPPASCGPDPAWPAATTRSS